MNTSNWHEPWFIWALVLGFGFPLLIVVLEEVIQQLKRSKNAFASTFQVVKNFVLPTLIVLVFARNVFKLDQEGAPFKILETLFLISGINIVLSLIDVFLFKHAEKGSWQSQIPKVVIDICRFLCILVGVMLVLSSVWQVDLAGLATLLGIVLLAISLALKDPLSSIFTGIMLGFERPFSVGDWLTIGEIEGQVINMNWLTMRLLTAERKMLILPYQVIGKQMVFNHAGTDNIFSTIIKFSFPCDNPPNLVKQVLMNTAISIREILKTPPPKCTTFSFEGLVITYELEFYVRDFETIKSIRGEFMSHLWYAARRNGLVFYHYSDQGELPTNKVENSKKKLQQSFSSIPAFIPITKEQRQMDDLAKETIIQHFGAGEQIVSQGERIHALYIVIAGSALMTVLDDADGELNVLTLSRGEVFGVESLFNRGPSPVSFMAVEDMEVMMIGEDALNALLVRQPNLLSELGKVIEMRTNAINIAKRTNQIEKT